MPKRTMFDQWSEFKNLYPNSIILFRVGTFFEILQMDAYVLHKTLDLTISMRSKGKGGHIPMSGFPQKSLELFEKKLVEAQIAYVVVQQMDTLEENSSIRIRQVTNVTTPDRAKTLSEFKDDYQSYLNHDFLKIIDNIERRPKKLLHESKAEKIIAQLLELDINNITAFESQMLLYTWQKELLQ